MKRFFIVLTALVLTLGLAGIAMAGDVKIGGEMFLNSYYVWDNDEAENPDYAGWFKLKLTQDVSDLASWQVTLNFDYPGNTGNPNNNDSWKTDSSNSTKLDDAFVKLKFNPSVSMRIGRFETNYDQKYAVTNITNFGGEWDGQKQTVGGDTMYALTNWKGGWRERNNFGFEFTEKAFGNWTFMQTFFFPENDKDSHYGLKASVVPLENLTFTGAYFVNVDDQKNYLLEATYKMDALAFYCLFNRRDLETDHNNVYALGASYIIKEHAFYIERYVMNGASQKTESKLGYEYFFGKNTGLYVNLLYPSDNDMVLRTGLALTF